MKEKQLNNGRRHFAQALRFTLPATALLLGALAAGAQGNDNRAPGVPANLAVPAGNKVQFHAYGVGVQIYTWNGDSSTWGASVPEAVLYDADGNIVGTHFAGPTWESNSGSKVVGTRLAASSANPPVDPNAIPWLLLQTKSSEGPGIFANITYIQRVNTAGGKAPATAGTPGQVVRVPYTAEYYFYRADPSANSAE